MTLSQILLLAACAGMLIACKEDATARAKEAAAKTIAFYHRYAIRGNWAFFGAEAKNKNVIVLINVPEQQATDLMSNAEEDARKSFIAYNACPPEDNDVWSTLEVDGDIIVQTRFRGNIFAEVSCRNQPKVSHL